MGRILSHPFGTFVGFHRQPTHLSHTDAKSSTQIERVYPRHGAIERTDGTVIGMIQVDPPSMALATEAEWHSMTAAFQDFCNTTIEFPIQIYSTTQDFPTEEYLAQYESRLDDPDVTANPRLEALITKYLDWYGTDLQERRMTIRDHYVIVTVAPTAVQFEPDSLLHQLATIPVVGLFVQEWFGPRIGEQRAAMFELLDERLRQVRAGLREIEGCTTHRVSVEEATRLIGEYWAGEPLEYGEMEQVLSTRPIVGGGQ